MDPAPLLVPAPAVRHGAGSCGVATLQRPPCSEPPGRAPRAQAAAQGVSSAIQNLARSPGPPNAPSAPVPVAFERQPFRASDYGQGGDGASAASGSASGAGAASAVGGSASAAGGVGAGRRLQVAAHWLGALGVAAGRRLLQLPLPPQPQPSSAPGGPGGPQDAGAAAAPPVRQSWAEVVQQSRRGRAGASPAAAAAVAGCGAAGSGRGCARARRACAERRHRVLAAAADGAGPPAAGGGDPGAAGGAAAAAGRGGRHAAGGRRPPAVVPAGAAGAAAACAAGAERELAAHQRGPGRRVRQRGPPLVARRAAAPLQGPRRGCPTGVAGDGLPLGHGRCHSGDLGADAGRTPACTALGLCRLAPHSVSAPAQLLATPALTYLSQAPSVGKGTLWSRLCAAWPHLSPQRARTLTADSYLCHVYCEQSKLVGPVSDAFCAVPSVACLTCCCTGGQARPQRGNLDVQCMCPATRVAMQYPSNK